MGEEKDQFKCQATIKRLQNEFTYVDPSKQGPGKNSQIDKKKEAVEETAKKPIMKKDKPTEPKTAPKKVSPDDMKKEMEKNITTESSKKSKQPSLSKGTAQTAKKSTENLEKKTSPVNRGDELITTLKTPTTKKGKSKVGTEKANIPSKPKNAAKSSTAEKKPKSITIKSNIPEIKKEVPSKKRSRDKSPKKTRSRSKPRAKK